MEDIPSMPSIKLNALIKAKIRNIDMNTDKNILSS